MSKFLKKAVYIVIASILVLFIGCMSKESEIVQTKTETTFYTFGDTSYEEQLKGGKSPVKHGKIAADQVPSNYPKKFLETDGSYAGGRVYRTIQEAQQAVVEAREKGMISKEGEWGIYQLNGDWDTYVYEYRPGDYRLSKPTTVNKKVY